MPISAPHQNYDLHASGEIDALWQKWYDAPMAVPVSAEPWF